MRHYESPPGKNRRTVKTIPSAVPTRRQPQVASDPKLIKISQLTETHLPVFATKTDVQQFFEESGFTVYDTYFPLLGRT
ncbi:hypothetical protein SNOG_00629 [Parastagonospora nodorum SN15]|uniref:Uncharacterized protein n=1 Tax=Phaeosphaeria nodorum (strain SN15 / ATCC MYA-4574 / FGSC 10173) TaxID=321614 RepID=Q0V5T5_PHANO|nr:hypothetical protein SNOG_00629 [Parastagonospora nodorum SN15]EAT92124.1 hypothetical protein SNOG_00629 [Parastagonospora nodorum SN15]